VGCPLTLTYRAYVAFGHDAAANSDLQYDDLQQSDQGQTHYTHNVFHHRAARTTELRTPPKRAQRVHLIYHDSTPASCTAFN
jgi:hypothetical protein